MTDFTTDENAWTWLGTQAGYRQVSLKEIVQNPTEFKITGQGHFQIIEMQVKTGGGYYYGALYVGSEEWNGLKWGTYLRSPTELGGLAGAASMKVAVVMLRSES